MLDNSAIKVCDTRSQKQADWPWGKYNHLFPETLPSGRGWPKISIITVTLNQGAYLEETILSVLNQGYPNLEYIVIDGGSSDNTQDILERYRSDLDVCISEKDKGQSDALNKGFSLANGEILAWLNSDDLYLSDTLLKVAQSFDQFQTDMVVGGCVLFKGTYKNTIQTHHYKEPVGEIHNLSYQKLLDLDGRWMAGHFFCQPEVFWRRDLWDRCGGELDERLFYSMDYDLWVKMARAKATTVHLPDTLTYFRIHDKQKTNFETRSFEPELRKVNSEYLEGSR